MLQNRTANNTNFSEIWCICKIFTTFVANSKNAKCRVLEGHFGKKKRFRFVLVYRNVRSFKNSNKNKYKNARGKRGLYLFVLYGNSHDLEMRIM